MCNRVVIVEDEFFVANHLKRILISNGYEVFSIYHEGETVLKNLDSIKKSVFILDIQLSSEINGVDIAVELNKRNLPFVYLTANTDELTYKRAIVTNPVAYIPKPFNKIVLLKGLALATEKLKVIIDSDNRKMVVDQRSVIKLRLKCNYIGKNLFDKLYGVSRNLRTTESYSLSLFSISIFVVLMSQVIFNN